MKIKDGGYIRGADINLVGDKSDRYSYMLLVFDGNIELDGFEYSVGNCFFIPQKQSCNLVVKSPVNCAWFAIEGAEECGASAISVFEIPDLEKTMAFAQLVCPDEAWKNENDKFSEGAALMLAALCGMDNGEIYITGNKYVDMAKRYIDENYSSAIKVEEIAEKFDVDRKYLRNLFFRYLGVSTKDYLMNVRIEKAKELLDSDELSVGEVALAVGYSDALGFSKIFKKHTGVSPSEYRSGKQFVQEEPSEELKPAKKEDIKYFLL